MSSPTWLAIALELLKLVYWYVPQFTTRHATVARGAPAQGLLIHYEYRVHMFRLFGWYCWTRAVLVRSWSESTRAAA